MAASGEEDKKRELEGGTVRGRPVLSGPPPKTSMLEPKENFYYHGDILFWRVRDAETGASARTEDLLERPPTRKEEPKESFMDTIRRVLFG